MPTTTSIRKSLFDGLPDTSGQAARPASMHPLAVHPDAPHIPEDAAKAAAAKFSDGPGLPARFLPRSGVNSQMVAHGHGLPHDFYQLPGDPDARHGHEVNAKYLTPAYHATLAAHDKARTGTRIVATRQAHDAAYRDVVNKARASVMQKSLSCALRAALGL